ncbi:MAG: hypothetical protein HN561_04230 [Candidatus Scalindua sp.]|nr:hypothetical protein [Candidatus Scalindua sp.]
MPTISAGNFFGFHPAQNGVEIWGSRNGPGGRGGLEWAAGIVNGETGEGAELFDGSGHMETIVGNMTDSGANGGIFGGEINKSKDWYVMVSYKIGGMGVLGEESVDNSLVAKENWRDDSVRIKGYYYRGVTGAFIDNPVTGAFGNPLTGGTFDSEANRFERFGVLIDANWRNFNFIGAASFMEDDIKGTITYGAGTFGDNLAQESGSSFHTSIYTAELQCVVLPWLIPAVRVENVNPDYDVRDIGSFTKYSFDTTVVTRANFKIFAGAHWSNYGDAQTGTDGVEVDRVDLGGFMDTSYRLGVDIAF